MLSEGVLVCDDKFQTSLCGYFLWIYGYLKLGFIKCKKK